MPTLIDNKKEILKELARRSLLFRVVGDRLRDFLEEINNLDNEATIDYFINFFQEEKQIAYENIKSIMQKSTY